MPQSNNSISFIGKSLYRKEQGIETTINKYQIYMYEIFVVNTQNAGRGQLKCHATDPDGQPVQLEYTQLDKHIYSVKIIDSGANNPTNTTTSSSGAVRNIRRTLLDRGYLNLYLEYQNNSAVGQQQNLLI